MVEDRAPASVSRRPTSTTEVVAARCPGCGYTYEVDSGEEREGFAAGTAWLDIPESWCCPDCGVRDKVDFVPTLVAWQGGSPPERVLRH